MTVEESTQTIPPAEGAKASLHHLIASGQVPIVFQPIVDLNTGEVIGHEALTSVADVPAFRHAGELYDAAAHFDLLREMESIALRCALQEASSWTHDGLLFVNSSPSVTAGDNFVHWLAEMIDRLPNLEPGRIVLELTERTEYNDMRRLQARTQELRILGLQIALDDVGSGISGLNRIMALHPNWVKLDRELVANIDHEPLQQNLMRSFIHFAQRSNMSLVAEGIERYEELVELVELGVACGQGYFLGRPGAVRPQIPANVRRSIVSLHEYARARRYEDPSRLRLRSLARPVRVYHLDDRPAEILETMAASATPDWAVVSDGRRCISVIGRTELERLTAAGGDGAVLADLELPGSTVVGEDVTLSEALDLAASRAEQRVGHPLVVDRGPGSVGLVTVRQLLRAASETHRRLPSHLAALTGLPSRVQADQWVAESIRAHEMCDIAFIDLRDFDAYNVAYGFAAGDTMLLRLAGLVKTLVVDAFDDDPFFAHLGEDRFMIAFHESRTAHLLRLIHEFDGLLGEFFSAADLEAGAFCSPDPTGEIEMHRMTSVRVVYVEEPLLRFASPRELQDVARELRAADRAGRFAGMPIIYDRCTDAGEGLRSA